MERRGRAGHGARGCAPTRFLQYLYMYVCVFVWANVCAKHSVAISATKTIMPLEWEAWIDHPRVPAL